MKLRFILIVPLVSIASIVWAQEPAQSEAPDHQEDAESDTQNDPEPLQSLIPTLPDYTGDIRSRSYLTGDWGGARTELAENGIIFSLDLTQVFQGTVTGGRDQNSAFRYSGSVDYTLKLDTARMGLWPAGLLYLKGETMFGNSLNRKVGSLMVPNADALFPVPDDPGQTTLTDVVYTQFLSETFGFAIGKIDFRGGDQNLFANSETEQFLNLAFLANPTLLRYAPYSALTAGVFYRPTEWLTVVFVALDSFGRPDTAGFDTAFHSPEGTTFINEWTFTINPLGLPGHQRFGFAYSNRDFKLLDQDLRLGGPIRNLRSLRQVLRDPKVRPDDWALYYNFDQYVYTEEEDPSQGIGLFGRFGWSSGEANPVSEFYSFGMGGKGIIPERDNDTFGVGYYYLNMSDDMPAFLGMNAEQGVEMYYNIEVTPWLHITPDLQVIIDPAGMDDVSTAVVAGVRMQMSF